MKINVVYFFESLSQIISALKSFLVLSSQVCLSGFNIVIITSAVPVKGLLTD